MVRPILRSTTQAQELLRYLIFDLFFQKESPTSASLGSNQTRFHTAVCRPGSPGAPPAGRSSSTIWQRTSLSRELFASCYRDRLECYADLVRQLPASEKHYRSFPW
ncbi:TraI domain-containing protein [Pseudomonas oryzihabitans]|uniref:TraI domain-containing protein n=1 Tax=Pseudomonas oryzihabitans TaxID=47885 RepID=UPI0031456B92